MKYAWIENNKLLWLACLQCRVLGVSASGYRQHRARRTKIITRRHLSETALLVEIRAVHTSSSKLPPELLPGCRRTALQLVNATEPY